MSESRRIPVLCGVMAGIMALVVQFIARKGPFHPSQLLNVAANDPIAGLLKSQNPAFQFTSSTDHYDGVYFLAMAQDPLATGRAHTLIDLAAYRYGHPLYSWLAGILSAGQPVAMPWAFWFLSVASMVAAGFVVARLAQRFGTSGWLGLIVAVNPGLLFSASTALTEPFQVALVGALVLAWVRPRINYRVTVPLIIAVCLTKEQLVLVLVGLGIFTLFQMRRDRVVYWRRMAALLAGPIVLGGWLLFIRSRFTADQLHYDSGNLNFPFVGLAKAVQLAQSLRVGGPFESQVGSTATSGIAAIVVIAMIAIGIGLMRRDALGWAVIPQCFLVFCLGWRTILYPHEMLRIPSVALTFAALLIVVHLTTPRPNDVVTSPGPDLSPSR